MTSIKQKILNKRGVKLAPRTRIPVSTKTPFQKTKTMLRLEARFNKPIEELIKGNIIEVSKLLGVVPSTISRWRKRMDA